MKKVDWRNQHKFNSYWIKIKFFDEKPKLDNVKLLKNVRFCEATQKVMFQPVLLDRESISCPGARYAFGWDAGNKNILLNSCSDKQKIQKDTLNSILMRAPYFRKPPKYIGLNTEDEPDLVISYMTPAKIMNLVKTYHNRWNKNLDVSLYSMMPICGGVVVRSYLENKISISFGCHDSRKYTEMRMENLTVGVPKNMFNIFMD